MCTEGVGLVLNGLISTTTSLHPHPTSPCPQGLTGLTSMHRETEAALENVDLFDDEDEDF